MTAACTAGFAAGVAGLAPAAGLVPAAGAAGAATAGLPFSAALATGTPATTGLPATGLPASPSALAIAAAAVAVTSGLAPGTTASLASSNGLLALGAIGGASLRRNAVTLIVAGWPATSPNASAASDDSCSFGPGSEASFWNSPPITNLPLAGLRMITRSGFLASAEATQTPPSDGLPSHNPLSAAENTSGASTS